MLILNKKSISNHENQLFQAELEKFRPHQTRLLQASHKQSSLLKELTATYGDLLQDRRVQSEQSKYESITRQRNTVMSRYRAIAQAFNDLNAGLAKAQSFYSEMRDTVESLEQNVETFVNNRRSEGAQLLNQIEQDKQNGAGGQADRERERLKELMERMSMDPSTSPSKSKSESQRLPPVSTSYQSGGGGGGGAMYPMASPPVNPRYPSTGVSGASVQASSQTRYGGYGSPENGHYAAQQQPQPPYNSSNMYQAHAQAHDPYNPGAFPRREPYQTGGPTSPPAYQTQFSPPPQQYGYAGQGPPPQPGQPPYMPAGYVPPPPPPGPPPLGPQQTFPVGASAYPAGPGGYARSPPPSQHQQHHPAGQPPPGEGDPWGGLSAWR